MEVPSNLEPECLGKINEQSGELCSTMCPFTALCVQLVMADLIRKGLLR